MTFSNGKPATNESTFIEDKKPKEEHDDSCCDLYEEEAKFVRNLKRDSRKYKSKLPFK